MLINCYMTEKTQVGKYSPTMKMKMVIVSLVVLAFVAGYVSCNGEIEFVSECKSPYYEHAAKWYTKYKVKERVIPVPAQCTLKRGPCDAEPSTSIVELKLHCDFTGRPSKIDGDIIEKVVQLSDSGYFLFTVKVKRMVNTPLTSNDGSESDYTVIDYAIQSRSGSMFTSGDHETLVTGSVIKSQINGRTRITGSVKDSNINGRTDVAGSVEDSNINGQTHVEKSVVNSNINGQTDVAGSVVKSKINGRTRVTGSVKDSNINGQTDVAGSVEHSTINGRTNVAGSLEHSTITGKAHVEKSVVNSMINGRMTNRNAFAPPPQKPPPNVGNVGRYGQHGVGVGANAYDFQQPAFIPYYGIGLIPGLNGQPGFNSQYGYGQPGFNPQYGYGQPGFNSQYGQQQPSGGPWFGSSGHGYGYGNGPSFDTIDVLN